MRVSAKQLRQLTGDEQRPATSGSPKMNKLEADYGAYLDLPRATSFRIANWQFGSVRLHLGGGAWYKPDFIVWLSDGGVEVHEVKGHWREAARVRIKVAASKFPCWLFLAVTRKDGVWQSEEIRP